MKVTSAKLIGQIHFEDDLSDTELKHVAFIGRSNVGKSSLINALTGKKELARSSSSAGHTKTINFFEINKSFYLVDLPGYGFAQGSLSDRKKLQQLIEWYLTYPDLDDQQLIVLIVDAKVGATDLDQQMMTFLQELGKNVVVAANKIDKIKKTEVKKQLQKIAEYSAPFPVIPVSTTDKVGLPALTKVIFEYVSS